MDYFLKVEGILWKKRRHSNAVLYMTFLFVYSFYARLIGFKNDFKDKDMLILTLRFMSLMLSWIYAFWMMHEECQRIISLVKDGKKLVDSKFRGLKIHFYSKWNWVQLTSCMTLLVFIPSLHALAYRNPVYNSKLAVFVGIESILVWFKVNNIWYLSGI